MSHIDLVKITDGWGQSHFVAPQDLHKNSIPLRFGSGRPYAEMPVAFRPNITLIRRIDIESFPHN